jgi:hypothetical protein
MAAYKDTLREITSNSNEALFQVVEDTSYVYSHGRPRRWSSEELRSLCESFVNRLVDNRDAFILRNQDRLLDALQRDEQPVSA